MFANILLVGKKLNALVDTGTSDLFASVETAKMLRLNTKAGASYTKTINSKEVPTKGTMSNVIVQQAKWVSKESI
ncbi:Uncharacterized protein TCM_002296 [Theobroma cacao]|uniref:Aspartyl protease n=1 Tax=Theobroma cacao TaxID=3641 RepID=A0A061DKT7_THECC|nr:Uncharacterized protein TCM_002296 [Theobroma cacao]